MANWNTLQTYGLSPNKAFESLCSQLFEIWGYRSLENVNLCRYRRVNGDGGDGGIEAYWRKPDGSTIGLQAKWFTTRIDDGQFGQIEDSIDTALKVRPTLKQYIVAIPRDLTSIRVVRGCNLTNNSEDQRWCKLCEKMEEKYPGLNIILWDDQAISSQLQFPENEGVYRYWFEDSLINEESIKLALLKQQEELSDRYIPELQMVGKIKDRIDLFVGAEAARKRLLKKLSKSIALRMSVVDAADGLIALQNENITEKLKMEVMNVKNEALRQLEKYKEFIGYLRDDALTKKEFDEHDFYLNFNSIEEVLADIGYTVDSSAHIRALKSSINALKKSNPWEIQEELRYIYSFGQLIVCGRAGTGKTCGIVDSANQILREGKHIPILISAKTAEGHEEWKDIIVQALSLKPNWDEDALFGALEASAGINDIASESDNEIATRGRVIIMVDGLDERRPYDYWLSMVRKSIAISDFHPRIKFCFSSRPEALSSVAFNDAVNGNRLDLYYDGDVPVFELFGRYIKYYGIHFSSKPSIKWAIRTPLALRLFCQNNKGSFIDGTCKPPSIASLLSSNIEVMENEFCKQHPEWLLADDYPIRAALTKITNLFLSETNIPREVLLNAVEKENFPCEIAKAIIDFLCRYGVISAFVRSGKEATDVPVTLYTPGMQPYYDYILAYQFIRKNDDLDVASLPEVIRTRMGSLQMLSVMLIEDKRKFLSDYPSLCANIDESVQFELSNFALVNAPAECSAEFKERILENMSINAEQLIAITNEVVLPVSRESGHPLGPLLLDSYLRSFETPVSRDIRWSIPSGLTDDDSKEWFLWEDADLSQYALTSDEKADGLPLVYAWRLGSVDNRERELCRMRMMEWALLCPEEFSRLFSRMSDVDDPQIREDLYAISAGLACCEECSDHALEVICETAFNELFAAGRQANICDAALRYYGRAIVEIGHEKGLLGEEEIGKCRPPYKPSEYHIPLALEATSGSSNGGFSEIHYDLSRYVLCDPISGKFLYRFNTRRRCNEIVSRFLDEAAAEIGLSTIEPDQFIIAAAFQFMLDHGWTEDQCFRHKGKTGKYVYDGVDVAIGKQHYHADHGEKSEVMTLCEKYVWCAREQLLGYLADRLPFQEIGDEKYPVDEYAILESFSSPLQEHYLKLSEEDGGSDDSSFELPENLSPDLPSIHKTREDLIRWIDVAPLPTFTKWIHRDDITTEINNPLVLYGYTSQSNSIGVETNLWIAAGTLDGAYVNAFEHAFKGNDSGARFQMDEPERFHAFPVCNCYCVPCDVCRMSWLKEEYSSFKFDLETGSGFEVYPASAECVGNFREIGDVYYRIPSKKLRQYLSITSGDGKYCYDEKRKIKAEMLSAGEQWHDYQELLVVDGNNLETELVNSGEVLFWIIRLYRSETALGREKYPDLCHRRDSLFLAYYEGNVLKVVSVGDQIG